MSPRKSRGGSSFVGGVLALSGGTGVAQVVVVLSAPILSRLFEPDAFGMLGLFSAVLGIATPLGCLMYYLALVLPKEEDEADNLLGLCFLIVLGTTVLVGLALYLPGGAQLAALGGEQIEPYRLLLAIGFLLTAVAAPLRTWNTRHQQFVRLAGVRVLSAVIVAVAAIGAGWLGASSGRELIIATVLGLAVPAGALSVAFLREDGARLARNLTFESMRRAAIRYRNFPYYVMATAFLAQALGEVPTLFFMGVFGPTLTGFYTLARRATVSPLQIFGVAIAEVFFQRAGVASAQNADLSLLVEGVGKRLITMALLPAVVLMTCGPQLFSVAFGARWEEAGLYASLLAMDLFGSFVGGGISRVLLVLERQRLEVILNVLALSAAFGALTVGGLVLQDPHAAILLFSMTGLAFGMTRLVICIRLTGSRGRLILAHVLRLLLYATPTVAIVLTARWVGASPAAVAVAAVLGCVPYGALVLREDEELQGALMRFLGRS